MKPPVADGSHTDDYLCHADQGSFLGLRALGRGPVLQFTWLLGQQPDDADVMALNARLAQGLFARLLQRSPLPWGRHRWVRSATPPPVTWLTQPDPSEPAPQWRGTLPDLDVDPEIGPGWRMVVQPRRGGGCVLSVLVSHTIADGEACVQTISDAIAGRTIDLGIPDAPRRWAAARLLRDGAESLRGLPGVGRALMTLAQRRRSASSPLAETSPVPQRTLRDGSAQVVDVPLLLVAMDATVVEARAVDLGVAVNTLLAALAVRIAHAMARVDAGGQVKLVLPVSDRQPGDRRGNALRAVTVMAAPETCLESPRQLQRDIRAGLSALLRQGDEISALLPLIPCVPLWLARRLERMALGSDLPVGCSILGTLPQEMERPCGAASCLAISLRERYTIEDMNRLGGQLFLVCYRTGGRFLVTASGYAPGRITTRDEFAPLLQAALADLGLSGTVS
jgi:hypothetical protein